jgi:hypothetical protein
MLRTIISSNAGEAALFKFATSNTWNAQQVFKSPSATVAGAVFQSSGTISTIPAGYGGSNLVAQFIADESSAFPYTLYESTGNNLGHVLAFRTSRGTYASRTAVQSADLLGQLDFGGHNSSSLVNGKASIQAQASQTWTPTANGTQLLFNLTANGTTAPTLQLTLTATGATFTNDIIAPYVQVNRPAGNSRPILYRSSGVTRWTMQATSTAESGSNAGSDWALDAHTDAGAYNFTALAISRSGGNATFYNLVTAPQLRISLSNPPASATATGSAGVIRWDANYIYVCTATDTWKRVAIATW